MNAPTPADKLQPWFLQDNWAPVLDEIDTGPLVVRGEIPRELRGDYVRAGMNPRSGHGDHLPLPTPQRRPPGHRSCSAGAACRPASARVSSPDSDSSR